MSDLPPSRSLRPARFQFGIKELATSIALVAAGLTFVSLLGQIMDGASGLTGFLAFVVTCAALTSCFLAALGVLFGRGIPMAYIGAIVGCAASFLLLIILSIITSAMGGI